MIVIPTIEVQGGRCVRPARGECAQPTVYAGEPVVLARTFIDEGAPRLHVVDHSVPQVVPPNPTAFRSRRRDAMNRLGEESSPYLRQHADNPVDWYPWGDEAAEAARERDRPIFLSVGYSACHWCHVMAHESFEDPEVATLMNHLFVNVKVDREERPDVDSVYMQAVQALTGSGGWPMSVWLAPDGRPFHAGTYFPPTDRHGMPSFTKVLEAVADAWDNRRDEVLDAAGQISEALARHIVAAPGGEAASADLLDAAVAGLRTIFDPRFGGFGRAPKFPPAMTLSFLCGRAATAPAPSVPGADRARAGLSSRNRVG